MVRSALAAALAATLAVLAVAGGCRTRFFEPPDSAPDAGPDAPIGDAPEALALDVAVTGCTRYDIGAARCFGAPPLTVVFSPVSSPSLTRFLWSFGDGSPDSSDRAPTHSYLLPGSYDVTVIGAGQVGTLSRTRRQLISVDVQVAGSPCDVDAQCATGLSCLCGAGSSCGLALARGLCTAPCVASVCGAGAVCADLGLDARADAGTDAGGGGAGDLRRPLCLASCQDGDCPTGLACRDLPGSGAAGQPRWVRACFPPVPADAGQPCRDPTGLLSDAACVTGTCADLGALGLCTASCGPAAPCPGGTACATLGDGRALCLRACATTQDCQRDPLLGCEPAGGAGPLGFTVAGAQASAGYCAPRPCLTAADCGPAGRCAGHCVRNQ